MFDTQDRQTWRHISVDMQRMFLEDTPWHVAWMPNMLPRVLELSYRYPEQTIFTRFMPPDNAQSATGTWRTYYEKWWMMTGEKLPAELTELIPELKALVPPARSITKCVYSPWHDGRLHRMLQAERVSALVLSGGETDVCVMATVFGAIDLGYRIIVLSDAVYSGADATHDASLELLGDRFSVQLELMETQDFLSEMG